jgi:hypothetical protein
MADYTTLKHDAAWTDFEDLQSLSRLSLILGDYTGMLRRVILQLRGGRIRSSEKIFKGVPWRQCLEPVTFHRFEQIAHQELCITRRHESR